VEYLDIRLRERTPPNLLTTLTGWFAIVPFELSYYTDSLKDRAVAFVTVTRWGAGGQCILLLGVERFLGLGSLDAVNYTCDASTYTPDVLFYIGARVGKWELLPDLLQVHGPVEGFDHCAAVGASYAIGRLSDRDRVLWHCKIEAVTLPVGSDGHMDFGSEVLVGCPVTVEVLSEPIHVVAGAEYYPEN
jgi:hypothetical protein